MRKKLKATETAWLAGLLEGEGYFGASRVGNSKKRYPRICLAMTDEDVVERAALMIGVICRKVLSPSHAAKVETGEKKQMFRLEVSGYKARDLMRLVAKHMGERRAQKIKESLEDWT